MSNTDQSVEISTDKNRMNIAYIHEVLKSSYWSKGRSKQDVIDTISNSRCYGIYFKQKQIGFARIVTDGVVFAYIMDVFIDFQHQGKGYGNRLMTYILNDTFLSRVKQWYLKTKDAHSFYESYGFKSIQDADYWMFKR